MKLSPSRVYDQVDAHLGMTPKTYQNGGDGTRIRFATVPTAMGWLLVAATERGVCAVSLGDDPGMLEAELRTEYPRADVAPGRDAVHDWLERIVAYLNGEARLPAIPLDVRATAFRWRVWKAFAGDLARRHTLVSGARTIDRRADLRSGSRSCMRQQPDCIARRPG